MDTKTVYVPVPIAERLPESTVKSFIVANREGEFFYIGRPQMDNEGFFTANDFWLEKQSVVVLSLDELEAIKKKAYEDGFSDGYNGECMGCVFE